MAAGTQTSPIHLPGLPSQSAATPQQQQAMANSYFSAPRLQTPHPSSTATNGAAKSPSPNYFGFQATTEPVSFLNDSPHHHAKGNWSPPSSAIRSTAAASPSVLPVDQNPEYEAFRRQSEGKAFNLGGLGGNFKMTQPPRPSVGRTPSRASVEKDSSKHRGQSRDMPPPHRRMPSKETLDPSSAELARSPKRVLSPGSAAQLEPIRKGSPAHFNSGDAERPHSLNQPRFKLPLDDMPKSFTKVQRSETLPSEGSPSEPEQYMVSPQRVVTLMGSQNEDMLILDLRVSTQYAKAHIAGALNLCIPTTLLKRPSFNVQKLAATFKEDGQRQRFENWRNSAYIIVYDNSSAHLKDAQICINTIRKFQSEGYEGSLHIIKGGLMQFHKSFPQHIESGFDSRSSSQGPKSPPEGPQIAPVIGGCPMPNNDGHAANPFFGNIRQNMDLIGGVGQIALKHPQKAAAATEAKKYPKWLQRAADDKDQGKRVSNKFEAIERREKKRMEDALSGHVSYGSAASEKPTMQRRGTNVEIAGIEKGTKNRYNNIWPFEHSRVKLQGVPKSGCDYFNANHVKAAWSHKRYISTQAPIPATFEDFWNAVWQQDVRVIVMLTAEKEGAQVKAHNYWDQKHYGPLHLDFLSEKRASLELSRIHKTQKKRPAPAKRVESKLNQPKAPLAMIDANEEKNSDQPYVIVRKFTLSHEKFPFEPMREITQLQYSSWPDFGAPAHPAHLLGLVEQTDAVVRATNKTHGSKEPEPEGERPVLVHCSAGCGRTGTFCTVDSVIDMLKRQRLSDGKRDGSPMHVDKKTHARSTVRTPAAKESWKSGDGDFFGSQVLPEAHENESVDGKWVYDDQVDLVEKTVEDFRHQRLSMVQSLRQYVLCYESVMEWLLDQSSDESPQS